MISLMLLSLALFVLTSAIFAIITHSWDSGYLHFLLSLTHIDLGVSAKVLPPRVIKTSQRLLLDSAIDSGLSGSVSSTLSSPKLLSHFSRTAS